MPPPRKILTGVERFFLVSKGWVRGIRVVISQSRFDVHAFSASDSVFFSSTRASEVLGPCLALSGGEGGVVTLGVAL